MLVLLHFLHEYDVFTMYIFGFFPFSIFLMVTVSPLIICFLMNSDKISFTSSFGIVNWRSAIDIDLVINGDSFSEGQGG